MDNNRAMKAIHEQKTVYVGEEFVTVNVSERLSGARYFFWKFRGGTCQSGDLDLDTAIDINDMIAYKLDMSDEQQDELDAFITRATDNY